MCRTIGEIMDSDIIIQEIDDYIAENNLEPLEKLTLRVLKHNYAKSIQIKEDVEELATCVDKHHDDKDLHSPKGLLVRGKVIAWFVGLAILIASIVTYLPELISRIPH